MLINYKVSGYKSFDKQVELDMKSANCSDNGSRLNINSNTKVNKTSIIYGSNNSGKTNIINSLKAFKRIFLKGSLEGFDIETEKNFSISDEDKVSFEIIFSSSETIYTYGIEFSNEKEIEEYLFLGDEVVFSKSSVADNYDELSSKYFDKEDIEQFNRVGKTKLFVKSYLETVDENVNIHIVAIENFFNKLSFFDSTKKGIDIGIAQVLFKNDEVFSLYNDLINAADVRLVKKIIDDESGIPKEVLDYLEKTKSKEREEEYHSMKKFLKNYFKIKSVYKKIDGENIVVDPDKYDSTGTDRFSQLILLIINSVINNKILFIDEIDNSLHYRLTRELIKFMSSAYNNSAQFVFTAHDVKLLIPEIFNKEQINFITCNPDILDVEMFSLSQFKSNSKNDVRNNSIFERKYVSGKIGALPDPDLIKVVEKWQEKQKNH